MKVERAAQVALGLLALPILYLASPLLVYALASLLGRNRGMDNQFADFLDAFYEPAQRLTEKWELYNAFILWCLEITRQN